MRMPRLPQQCAMLSNGQMVKCAVALPQQMVEWQECTPESC